MKITNLGIQVMSPLMWKKTHIQRKERDGERKREGKRERALTQWVWGLHFLAISLHCIICVWPTTSLLFDSNVFSLVSPDFWIPWCSCAVIWMMTVMRQFYSSCHFHTYYSNGKAMRLLALMLSCPLAHSWIIWPEVENKTISEISPFKPEAKALVFML